MPAWALSLAVALAIMVAACGTTLVSVASTSRAGCLRDQRTTQALRTIIARSSQSVEALHKKGQLDDELYARSREQNRLALESLVVPAC